MGDHINGRNVSSYNTYSAQRAQQSISTTQTVGTKSFIKETKHTRDVCLNQARKSKKFSERAQTFQTP